MVRRGLVIGLLLVAGCNESPSVRDVAADAAADAVRPEIDPLKSDIADLKQQMKDLTDRQAALEASAAETAKLVNYNARVVTRNAQAANQNAARNMTLRGACGQEYRTGPNGAPVLQNRECTVRDLK